MRVNQVMEGAGDAIRCWQMAQYQTQSEMPVSICIILVARLRANRRRGSGTLMAGIEHARKVISIDDCWSQTRHDQLLCEQSQHSLQSLHGYVQVYYCELKI